MSEVVSSGFASRQPWPQRARTPLIIIAALIPLMLAAGLIDSAYTAHRFASYAVTVDARISNSDMGCFGAFGSGTGMGTKSTITYEIEFPYLQGRGFRTKVVRPCHVIPPDFGRGRGSIWVQYDRDNPDRTRVLNDDEAALNTRRLAVVLIGYLVIGIIGVVAWRRTRPTPSV